MARVQGHIGSYKYKQRITLLEFIGRVQLTKPTQQIQPTNRIKPIELIKLFDLSRLVTKKQKELN